MHSWNVWYSGKGGGNYFPFILFNEIKTTLSQLAKQSHWNISADNSIADENYVLSRKNMEVNQDNNPTRLDIFFKDLKTLFVL